MPDYATGLFRRHVLSDVAERQPDRVCLLSCGPATVRPGVVQGNQHHAGGPGARLDPFRRHLAMSRTRKKQRGFSIIELMVAVFILAMGVLACMGMLLTGMATNVVNKNDSAGTMLSQMVIEQIYTLPVDS